MAEFFSNNTGKVIKTYLNIKNPADLTQGLPNEIYNLPVIHDNNLSQFNPDEMWELFDEGYPGAIEFVSTLKENGYDGAKIVERENNGKLVDVYITFSPNQIKSAIGNNGNFDANNNDIRYSKGNPQQNLQPDWSIPEESKMDKLIYALQDKQVDLKRVTQAIKFCCNSADFTPITLETTNAVICRIVTANKEN